MKAADEANKIKVLHLKRDHIGPVVSKNNMIK